MRESIFKVKTKMNLLSLIAKAYSSVVGSARPSSIKYFLRFHLGSILETIIHFINVICQTLITLLCLVYVFCSLAVSLFLLSFLPFGRG